MQGAQLGQHPANQRDRFFALGLEAGDDAQGARGVAAQRGIGQAKRIEARIVGDAGLERVDVEQRAIQQQHELVDFLRGGEQVAFDAIGEALDRIRRGLDAARGEARADPGRHLLAPQRPYRHHHAGTLEGVHPGRFVLLAPFLRGDHQHGVRRR